MKLPSQIVGNTGMYYACYKLSRMGWNVMPTARNARGVDIIAYNTGCTKLIGIQVKALSKKKNAVPLGNSLEKIMGDYWVIVTNVIDEPVVFVMEPDEVRSLAERKEKDGKISYWLQYKSFINPRYEEAWETIGRGDT